MKEQFAVGNRVIVTTTAIEHPVILNGARAVVTRVLGDDERDPEVGPMYEVTVTMQVFEDELRPAEASD